MALAICISNARTVVVIMDTHTNVIDFPLNYFRVKFVFVVLGWKLRHRYCESLDECNRVRIVSRSS